MRRLHAAYPDAHCELDYDTPWQLLVAVVLSAQCTDVRVNQVTPELFARFPDPVATSRATIGQIEDIVRPTGFFRNKARSILAAARYLIDEHDGLVPRTMAELVRVPGAGRKTASVVLGEAFGRAEGIAVDTHVQRITRLLGLVEGKDATAIERELMTIVPKRHWVIWTHLLIAHGRAVCIARRPQCAACVLRDICPEGQRRSGNARAR